MFRQSLQVASWLAPSSRLLTLTSSFFSVRIHNKSSYSILTHLVVLLSTLPVSRLYSADDRMINECGAVGGMGVGKGNRNTGENLTQCHIVHANPT
jgi:hypothetical protein